MPSALINVMSAAAIKASKNLLRDFGEVERLQISKKGTANFVTKADIRTEKMLIDELRIARPDFGFLAEESGEIKGKDATQRWVIDPIDGTNNFIHAIPYFCISIALEKIHNKTSEILAGVIYDPLNNDLFYSEKGKGAFHNDRRLMVSKRDNFEESMLVTPNPRPTQNNEHKSIQLLDAACRIAGSVRCMGATALDLAYIAAGRFDAGWYPRQQPWDVAAGILLVQEAGGVVSQINGEPYAPGCTTILASNKELYPQMLKLLADAA